MCDRSDLENHYIEKDAEEGGLRNIRKQTELRYERQSVLKAVSTPLVRGWPQSTAKACDLN
jgi:hypothetical protein